MPKKAKGGRPVIYGPKNDKRGTVRALALTREGRTMFEDWRRQVKRLNRWPGKVSDADVIEYLVRR